MTNAFKIKQPFYLILYLTSLHIFVAFCLYHFLLSENIKVPLLIGLAFSLCYYVNKYYKQTFDVVFHPVSQTWSVAKTHHQYRQFDQIRTVYLNEIFLWVILGSANGEKLSLMASAESMTEEEFRQLRRYIISPELYK